MVALREIGGWGNYALYRLGEYREPYPHQDRTVVRPTGDPLFLMEHYYEDNLPLCHCGGTIIVADSQDHDPGCRLCTDCATPLAGSTTAHPGAGRPER